MSNYLHWFHPGSEWAIGFESSTTIRDESEIFTDPRIQRIIGSGGVTPVNHMSEQWFRS